MKKRFALSFIIVSLVSVLLMAAPPENMTTFMNPFEGATNIPLDSSAYGPVVQRDGYNQGGFTGAEHDNFLTDSGYRGKYSNFNMIATGGIRNIPVSALKAGGQDLTITLTLESPVGLNFVSLSNPQIKRPFNVYVVLKFARGAMDSYDEPYYDYPLKFTKSGESLSKTFSIKEIDRIKNLNGGGNMAGDYCSIWYDMVIELPGELPANWNPASTARAPYSLADVDDFISIDGAKYKLVQADDYSSVIYATMEVSGPESIEGVNTSRTIAIPLNGLYTEAKQPVKNPPSKIAMSIVPSPFVHNLDLMKQQGQFVPIADISITLPTVRLNEKDPSTLADSNKQVYMFLSSHSDPYASVAGVDDRFMLRHESISPYDPYNTRTHMLYTVELQDTQTGIVYTYDGTMNVSNTFNPKDPNNQNAFGIPGGENLNKLVPTMRSEPMRDMQGNKAYQSLDADVRLKMENKQGLGMKRGVYRSKIYVHIMTDETL